MFQSVLAPGAVPLETALQDFLNETRMEAARAFRVLRDLGRIDLAADLDFIVRAPGRDWLARFGHPGLWSVSLDPKVAVTDLEGRPLTRGRDFPGPIEDDTELFRRRPDLAVIARFHAPHLDAWARGGRDLPFTYGPLARADVRRGIKTYERGSAARALDGALDDGFAGVLHQQGGAVLAGGGVLSLAQLMLQVERAAQVELLSEVWRRPGEPDQERASLWAS